MPDNSTYQRICEQECEWCAKGSPIDESGRHWNPAEFVHDFNLYSVKFREAPICTAPTKDAVIDALFRYYEETHNATGMGYPSHRLKDVESNQTAVIEVIERQAKEIEELRADVRMVAGGAKTLVRCGCLGCLTDDCGQWGKDCLVSEMTLCRIGRTIDAMFDALKEETNASR